MLLGHSAREQRIAQHRTRLQDYESFCGGLGEKPADVALAWLLAQPGVAAPVTGPRTREQLDGSLRALEITMAPEILSKSSINSFPVRAALLPRHTLGINSSRMERAFACSSFFAAKPCLRALYFPMSS